VEYSLDNFANILRLETVSNEVDFFGLPTGFWQWRVNAVGKGVSNEEQFIASGDFTVQELVSEANGNTDLFFANANGKWSVSYAAQHSGFLNGWSGTDELVELAGKNKLSDIFEGSTDANILVLTDDANGDALFVEDIYTSFGKDAARISRIQEIRAGAGDDIVDMTSQRFAYSGDGIRIYGGLGNDTIWANNGTNILSGDAGNDRIAGGSGNDVIMGGIGNDSMHGGGGDDIFCFGSHFGTDTVEQLAGGKITLWFESGSERNWDASTRIYTDGENSVTVYGNSNVSLRFGADAALPGGAFSNAASEKIFEDKEKGMLA
jgi:Ca2+-binding RTX toxin-like protein